MADGKRTRGQALKLVEVVQDAVDEGAKTVEEIHRSVAALPLEALERLDLFEQTVKDVRKVQDASIGAIYDLIHKVNREVAKLARELLAPSARKRAPSGAKKRGTAAAHAR